MTNFIFQTEVLQRASAPAGKTRKFGPVRSMSFGKVCKYLYTEVNIYFGNLSDTGRTWATSSSMSRGGPACSSGRSGRDKSIKYYGKKYYHYLLQGCLLALYAQLPRGSGKLCRRVLDRPTGTQDRVPEKLTGRSLDRLAIRKTFQVLIFIGDNLVFRAGYGSSKDVSMYSSLGG